MQQANKHGVSFDHFIKPLTKPDVIFRADASLKIGVGGVSNKGHYIQHEWTHFEPSQPDKEDIIWRELVAVYPTLH